MANFRSPKTFLIVAFHKKSRFSIADCNRIMCWRKSTFQIDNIIRIISMNCLPAFVIAVVLSLSQACGSYSIPLSF